MIVQVCEENLRVLLFFCLANRWTPSRGQELGVKDVRSLTTSSRSHLR
jgi:hypothetical protein